MSEYAAGKKKPRSFSELYPGRFLHADHFNGKHVTLTIADVDREELHGENGKEAKVVVAFRETPLLLVLPKINGTCLKAMFGPNVQEWVGKRVTFYPTDKLMPMQGEPCVRVWGSPDIAKDIDVEFCPPRRKAIKMTMRREVPKGPAKAPAEPPPENQDADPPFARAAGGDEPWRM